MVTKTDLELLKSALNNCQFEEVLGKSTLGTVYRVQHATYGDCVLKYFEGAIMDNQKLLQELSSDIDKAKDISYPTFGKIYQFSLHPCPFILREWVPGENLQELSAKKTISSLQATEFLIDMAWGLQAAYNFGLRHKNLKPQNFIVSVNQSIKTIDAFLPPTLPEYLSPEHCRGETTDIRADIYSLGTIYYHILAGAPPFTGSANQIMRQHQEVAPNPIAQICPEIQAILDKCLVKDCNNRYQNPLQLIESLSNVKLYLAEISQENLATEVANNNAKNSSKLPNGTTPTMVVCVDREITTEIPELDEEYEKSTMTITKVEGEAEETSLKRQIAAHEEIEDPEENRDLDEDIESENLEQIEIEEIEEDLPFREQCELPQDLPANIHKSLLLATGVRDLKRKGEKLAFFTILCPNNWKENVLEYLRTVLHRECWVLKEMEEETEIVIDLELAKTFRYFHFFEDCVQDALAKLPKLPSIQKTVVTQIEPMEEDSLLAENKKSRSLTSHTKIGSICSVVDSIVSISQSEDGHDTVFDSIAESSVIEEWKEENENSAEANIDKEESVEALELTVNFNNPYQTRAWLKLVKEQGWEANQHFSLKERGQSHNLKKLCFSINLRELQEYERKRVGISRVKDFFQGDYEITRLDQGGMAAVLKIITKNETIIFLRPENHWAREKLKNYLCVRRGSEGKEFVYAEVPKGTEFVVKVAFKGREEALIYECRLLSNLAEDSKIARHIIGMIQQGSFLTSVEQEEKDGEQLGYYLMLEYASLGNVRQFSRRFPENRLPAPIAFLIMYSIVHTLLHLKPKGIIHRDIKPQNILLDANGVAKLSDFGLAITVDEAGSQLNEERRRLLRLVDKEFLQITTGKEQAETRLKRLRDKLKRLNYPPQQEKFTTISYQITDLYSQIKRWIEKERARAEGLRKRYRPMSAEEIAVKGEFAGSLLYAAPEQFSPSKVLTCQCDVYQLAAVMYTMMTAKTPVKGRNITDIMGKIVFGDKPRIADIVAKTPLISAISELNYKMMESDPEQRLTIEQVQEQLEDIFLEYAAEIKAELSFAPPEKYKEGSKEYSKWRKKTEYAKEFHRQILPQFEALLKELESSGKLQKKRRQNMLKAVYILHSQAAAQKHIRFRCPSCSKKLQLSAKKAGKKIRCPNCQQKLIAKLVEEE